MSQSLNIFNLPSMKDTLPATTPTRTYCRHTRTWSNLHTGLHTHITFRCKNPLWKHSSVKPASHCGLNILWRTPKTKEPREILWRWIYVTQKQHLELLDILNTDSILEFPLVFVGFHAPIMLQFAWSDDKAASYGPRGFSVSSTTPSSTSMS